MRFLRLFWIVMLIIFSFAGTVACNRNKSQSLDTDSEKTLAENEIPKQCKYDSIKWPKKLIEDATKEELFKLLDDLVCVSKTETKMGRADDGELLSQIHRVENALRVKGVHVKKYIPSYNSSK